MVSVAVNMNENDGDSVIQNGEDVFLNAGIAAAVIRKFGRFFDKRQFVFMACGHRGRIPSHVITDRTTVRIVLANIRVMQ